MLFVSILAVINITSAIYVNHAYCWLFYMKICQHLTILLAAAFYFSCWSFLTNTSLPIPIPSCCTWPWIAVSLKNCTKSFYCTCCTQKVSKLTRGGIQSYWPVYEHIQSKENVIWIIRGSELSTSWSNQSRYYIFLAKSVCIFVFLN